MNNYLRGSCWEKKLFERHTHKVQAGSACSVLNEEIDTMCFALWAGMRFSQRRLLCEL